jgi:hypothetical protein
LLPSNSIRVLAHRVIFKPAWHVALQLKTDAIGKKPPEYSITQLIF